MAMLAMVGRDMNVLLGGTPSSVPLATTFPWTLAYDGRLGTFGRFGSLTAAPLVYVDIDMLRGVGSFETFPGGTPFGWIEANSGTGDVAQEGTIVHGGVSSARFTAGTGTAACYRDVTVRAGQFLYIDIWLRADGGAGQIALRCRNRQTGRWMTAGVWSPSDVETFVHATTTWTRYQQVFTVEDRATCGGPSATLRFQLSNVGSGGVSYADDFILVPGVTTAAVLGHNIDPRSGPVELRGSANNFASSTLVATPTLQRTSFYTTFARQFFRYWGWQFLDTNEGSGPIWLAEWILGEPLQLLQPPDYPIVRSYRDPQVRGELPYGGEYAVGVGPEGQLSPGLQLSFRQNDAAVKEFLDEVFARSSGGYPLLLVPDSTKPDVFFGRIPPTWDTRRVQMAIHDCSLELKPSPLPLLVP